MFQYGEILLKLYTHTFSNYIHMHLNDTCNETF